MDQGALALDEQELAPAPASLDDEAFGGPGDEVRDHGVDRNPSRRSRSRSARSERTRRRCLAPAPLGRSRARRSSSRSRSPSRPGGRSAHPPRGWRPSGSRGPSGGRRRSRSSTLCSRASGSAPGRRGASGGVRSRSRGHCGCTRSAAPPRGGKRPGSRRRRARPAARIRAHRRRSRRSAPVMALAGPLGVEDRNDVVAR